LGELSGVSRNELEKIRQKKGAGLRKELFWTKLTDISNN